MTWRVAILEGEMGIVSELHQLAMEAADLALAAQRRGDLAQSTTFFECAYEVESRAARWADKESVSEPTRSVLFRSAATLALDCGLSYEGEQLALEGLQGNPPEPVASELREVRQRAAALLKAPPSILGPAKVVQALGSKRAG